MKFQSNRHLNYRGVFKSFEESNAAISTSAFESSNWIERQREFLDIAIHDGNSKRIRPENLSALLTQLSDKEICIIDFGGGSGWLYFTLPEMTLNKVRKYFVVEKYDLILGVLPNLESIKRDSSIGSVKLEYSSTTTFDQEWLKSNLSLETTNILYMNSVIQYLPELEFLESILPLFEFVLIEDVTEHSSLSFWTHQTYYDTIIPRKIFAKNELSRELMYYGCCLIEEMQYVSWENSRYVYQDDLRRYKLNNPKTYLYKTALSTRIRMP
jgi:putative methyltransferase (TIGR04325 family)